MGTITLDRASLPTEIDELKPGQTVEAIVTFKITDKTDSDVTGVIKSVETEADEEADTEDADDADMESEKDNADVETPSSEEQGAPEKKHKGLGVLIMMGGKGK